MADLPPEKNPILSDTELGKARRTGVTFVFYFHSRANIEMESLNEARCICQHMFVLLLGNFMSACTSALWMMIITIQLFAKETKVWNLVLFGLCRLLGKFIDKTHHGKRWMWIEVFIHLFVISITYHNSSMIRTNGYINRFFCGFVGIHNFPDFHITKEYYFSIILPYPLCRTRVELKKNDSKTVLWKLVTYFS